MIILKIIRIQIFKLYKYTISLAIKLNGDNLNLILLEQKQQLVK
jgi:hypothetical protein